jgi:hypothetical protein
MTLIIYQFDENPHMIEEIELIEIEGDDIIVTSRVDGRLPFNVNDVVKCELVK